MTISAYRTGDFIILWTNLDGSVDLVPVAGIVETCGAEGVRKDGELKGEWTVLEVVSAVRTNVRGDRVHYIMHFEG